jgi:hypothetical protein
MNRSKAAEAVSLAANPVTVILVLSTCLSARGPLEKKKARGVPRAFVL